MNAQEFSTFIEILRSLFPQAPQFDGAQLNAWYRFFQKFPLAQAFAILPEVPKQCDRFPSIKQLLDLLEPKADKDAEARVIADAIWSAIERFGSVQSKANLVRETIGELGWRVVEQMGGWRVVCQIADYDNAAVLKAQWRESIKAHMQVDEVKMRREQMGLAPGDSEKPSLPGSDRPSAIEAPRNDRVKLDLRSVIDEIRTRKVT